MKAPAGPPIWKRLPPSAEIRKPPTIAVYSPRSGVAPRGDGDRHRERQRDDRDGEPGDGVGPQLRQAVALAQDGHELRREQLARSSASGGAGEARDGAASCGLGSGADLSDSKHDVGSLPKSVRQLPMIAVDSGDHGMGKAIRVHAMADPRCCHRGSSHAAPGRARSASASHAIGVNFIDIYFRTGPLSGAEPAVHARQRGRPAKSSRVGEGVEGFKPGDRVAYADGPRRLCRGAHHRREAAGRSCRTRSPTRPPRR